MKNSFFIVLLVAATFFTLSFAFPSSVPPTELDVTVSNPGGLEGCTYDVWCVINIRQIGGTELKNMQQKNDSRSCGAICLSFCRSTRL